MAAASGGIGHGATFTIRLPLVAVMPETAEAIGDEMPTSAGVASYRIFVADDNTDAAETLASVLKYHAQQQLIGRYPRRPDSTII